MKHLILLAFFFVSALISLRAQKAQTLEVKTSIYCDHCLQCESCDLRIQNALFEVKGVRSVKVKPEQNTILVSYKSAKTTPEAIRKAIATAGFEADGQKPSATGYEKLDACCKRR